MESPVTLRLDSKTRRLIANAARRKGISKSEVIRRALAHWTELQDASARPYETIADLVGVVHGGDRKRSEEGGRKLQKMLSDKRKRY